MVVSDQSFRNSLSNSVDLRHLSTTRDSYANVYAGEFFLTEQENWFKELIPQDSRFDEVKRSSINVDESTTTLAVCDGGGGFLPAVHLDRLNCFTGAGREKITVVVSTLYLVQLVRTRGAGTYFISRATGVSEQSATA